MNLYFVIVFQRKFSCLFLYSIYHLNILLIFEIEIRFFIADLNISARRRILITIIGKLHSHKNYNGMISEESTDYSSSLPWATMRSFAFPMTLFQVFMIVSDRMLFSEFIINSLPPSAPKSIKCAVLVVRIFLLRIPKINSTAAISGEYVGRKCIQRSSFVAIRLINFPWCIVALSCKNMTSSLIFFPAKFNK